MRGVGDINLAHAHRPLYGCKRVLTHSLKVHFMTRDKVCVKDLSDVNDPLLISKTNDFVFRTTCCLNMKGLNSFLV